MKKLLLLFIIVSTTGCVSKKKFNQTRVTIYESNEYFVAQLKDPKYPELGEKLKIGVFGTTLPLRKKVGRSKKTLFYSGIISTGVGTTSSLLIGGLNNENDKKNVGFGVSIGVSLIGIIQMLAGQSKSAADYITKCTEAIGDWDLSKKDKAAYLEFRKQLLMIQLEFPEYANFPTS